MTTEKQPSKYLRKIMNKSKENRKKGLASPIFNTISDMKKWYDNQDDTTEKQETQKIDHSIDVRYEPDIIKAFNKFIEKWCGNYYPHLIDTDQNDGEFMRDKLQLAVEKAYQDGYEKGHEAACEFYRSERDILLKDKEKARIEVAEEIFNEFDTRLKKDHDVVDIYLLAGLKAKYLSPTQEKLLCGCPKSDRFAMCINQEHCTEKVQNKINTGSIDTEEK